MSVIENAVTWAINIANDNTHGYDQINRQGPDYDCSSLVINAWKNAGVNTGATYTGNMYKQFTANGFKDVTKSCNLITGTGLERGDVLLIHIEKGRQHTAMYCGNMTEVEASINEKGTAKGGKTGDQTGKEILVRAYRKGYFNTVLRYGTTNSLDAVARDVIAGKYGNGTVRKRRLEKAGYNYLQVQKRVNELLRG